MVPESRDWGEPYLRSCLHYHLHVGLHAGLALSGKPRFSVKDNLQYAILGWHAPVKATGIDAALVLLDFAVHYGKRARNDESGSV